MPSKPVQFPSPDATTALISATHGAATGIGVVDAGGHLRFANQALADVAGLAAGTDPVGVDLVARLSDRHPDVAVALGIAFEGDAPAGVPLGAALELSVEKIADGRRLVVVQAHNGRGGARGGALESEIDSLTGLGNRVMFERIVAEWTPGGPDASSLALILIDLDRFKQVNDTLGHDVGDTLLGQVAKRLKSATRDDDPIVRLGGDEFVILHRLGRQPEGAESVGRRVVELIGRAFLVHGHQIHIGASVGVAALNHGSEHKSALYKHADLALYAAKAAGGGAVRLFRPEFEAEALKRREFEIDLRRALGRKEFEIEYQPQFALTDQRLTGFEALVRWRHPNRGRVSPLEFIALAEELGEIHAIGEWVLRTACHEAAGWPSDLAVAVNVSPVQFDRPDIVASVQDALTDSGLAPSRLEIEVTESVLMTDSSEVVERLHAIRDMGVGVALDDFGTGYSSLSYLNSFPFSKIKIDKSFVQGHETNARSGALVRSILALGDSLGMATLAEGVETPEQFAALAEGGCKSAQGYLFGKPIPRAEVERFIASSTSGRVPEEIA